MSRIAFDWQETDWLTDWLTDRLRWPEGILQEMKFLNIAAFFYQFKTFFLFDTYRLVTTSAAVVGMSRTVFVWHTDRQKNDWLTDWLTWPTVCAGREGIRIKRKFLNVAAFFDLLCDRFISANTTMADMSRIIFVWNIDWQKIDWLVDRLAATMTSTTTTLTNRTATLRDYPRTTTNIIITSTFRRTQSTPGAGVLCWLYVCRTQSTPGAGILCFLTN